MKLRFIYYTLVFYALWACNSSKTETAVSKPNILIMLADDMGYADLGSYGGMASTPHLDSLTTSGIRFTNFYAGAPNCSPSRVSLLTGRIPFRSGMYSYRPPNHVMHLPDREVTMAEMLKDQGYQTAHIGKWHLGCLQPSTCWSSSPTTPGDSLLHQPQPVDQGFDYSLGTENNAEPSHLNPVNFIRNGKALGEVKGYSCQLLADEAGSWLEKEHQADRPFFMYVTFHEPHRKVASPPELVAKYPDQKKTDAEYFANIENLDLAVGRILNNLKSRGLLDNTLVVFLSDNGPYRMGSQGDLRGLKGEVYDGGIKVPGIFSFPEVFEGGRVVSTPAWFQDILPTVKAMSGGILPDDRPYDGVSLLPLLENDKRFTRANPMFWAFYRSLPELALRKDDYMLVARTADSLNRTHWVADVDMSFIKTMRPEFFELYNVKEDEGQQNDLADEQPEKAEELKKELMKLLGEVQAEGPDWEGLPAYDADRANHNKPGEFERNKEQFLKR